MKSGFTITGGNIGSDIITFSSPLHTNINTARWSHCALIILQMDLLARAGCRFQLYLWLVVHTASSRAGASRVELVISSA